MTSQTNTAQKPATPPALELSARYRLKTFPLAASTKNRPLFAGWPARATDDEAQLLQWAEQYPGCNWAHHCVDLLVIDIDTKAGKPGQASYEALTKDRALPRTLTVATPTGGRHEFFRMPAGQQAKLSVEKLAPGLDVRADNGYVVAVGSRTELGEYRILVDAPIADAPQWLIDEAGKAAKRDERPATAIDPANLDHPVDVARANEYLKTAPRSVKGQGGDQTAYKVACKLRDLGISYHLACELMRSELWDHGCGWRDDWLEQKPVRSAFRYGQNAPGAESLSTLFKPTDAALNDPIVHEAREKGWQVTKAGNVYHIGRAFEDEADPDLARVTATAAQEGWDFTRTKVAEQAAEAAEAAGVEQPTDELAALDHELQAPSREHATGGEDEELYGPMDIAEADIAGADYLVKGWIGRGILAQAFGTWNAGKTAATDSLAVHVAAGAPWFGNRVRQGGVLVCSYEGKGRRKRRIAALKIAYPDLPWESLPIRWVNLRKPLVVEGGNGACAGRRVLLRNLRQFKAKFGAYPALVVVDPLANALGGPEEPPYTRPYLALARGIIRVTGATVLHAHHTGHSDKSRGRGDSALPADADADLKIEMIDESTLVGTIKGEKQRDDAKGVLHYRLKVVKLGKDSDGDPVTSIACVPAGQAGEDDFPVPNLTKAEQLESDRQRVVSYLQMQPAGFEFSVWGLGRQCKEIGLTQDRAEAAAEGLRAMGAFEAAGTVGKGQRYRLPSGPAKVSESARRSSLAVAQASLSDTSDGFERVTPSRSSPFPKSDERKRRTEPVADPDLDDNPWVALMA